jgi:cytoskeletal protein RodZ
MADLSNILEEQEPLNDEQLMKYLQGKLSDEEQHEVEKQMADSDFMNDAVEGLQHFRSNRNIDQYVLQLNHELKKQTNIKKKRREKRKLQKNDWITLSVIIVLLLSILCYVVIREIKQRQNNPPAQQINKN